MVSVLCLTVLLNIMSEQNYVLLPLRTAGYNYCAGRLHSDRLHTIIHGNPQVINFSFVNMLFDAEVFSAYTVLVAFAIRNMPPRSTAEIKWMVMIWFKMDRALRKF